MKNTLLILSFLALSYIGFSQNPCMQSWSYRVPVTIDNTTNPDALFDYQLKLILNTDSLISGGILKADAGDLRFTNAAGVQLPFWIVNNTLNTTNTEIWVNIDNIPPSSTIDIYMFYGQQNALSVIDGDATFLHYDNFDGVALDFSKWSFCGGVGGGTIPTVSAGEISFNSSNMFNHMIKSSQSFSGPITTEMKVNSFNNGIAYLGQVNSMGNGYGMALENSAMVDVMRLVSSDNALGDTCLNLIDQSPVNSVNAGATQGLWSFTWSQANEQLFSWQGGNETRTDFIDSTNFSVNDKNVIIGSFNNMASLSVDYIYTRKYSPIVPSYSYGSVTELVDHVEASANTSICVGDSLKLFAPTFSGAIYNWVGPNGFTSNNQNPVIPISDFTMVGKYVLTVSAPTNCSAVSDSVIVTLDSVPIAGSILSDTTVCKGNNQINLELTNTTGRIVYWESANTLGGPWNTISNTTNVLFLENLVNTQYYRAIVGFGSCGYDTSNIASIRVDNLSSGGNVIGTGDACYGFNSGILNLINQRGNIVKWESSIDDGLNWTDIATKNNYINYNNLTDTTWYRVLIKNGVCDSSYSDTAIIFVQPLPVVNFYTPSACLGYANNFINNSTIPTGTIDKYFWDFSDGNSSVIANPVHTFNDFGSYPVYLKAISDKGCVDSIRLNAIVNPLPNVSFSQLDVCDTSTMVFSNTSTIPIGTIDSISWSFGDGIIDTLSQHLYATFGTYNVVLTAFSDSACVDSSINKVRVLQRSIVDFTLDSVCHGQSIAFVNNSISFQDSTAYSWNFGDGNFSSAVNPSYVYNQADTFEVVLQATTYGMCINTKVDTLIVYPLPQTNFSFQNECQYDSVRFNNNSTIQWGNLTYFWDFGDTNTSTDTNGIHQYSVPSNYLVTLEATSDFGCKTNQTLLTEVYPIPNANFVRNDVCRDTLTPITNTSNIISGSMTYNWNFDNGDVSIDYQPNYTYPIDGNYAIKLVATSNHGCLDSVTKNINIYPIPQTSFISDTVCNGLATNLINTTTINNGFINSYFWNLGDTTFNFNTDVSHTYQYSGLHNVTLRAVSNKGCQKDTTINILVNPYPQVDFDFNNACVQTAVQFNNQSTLDFGTIIFDWKFGDDSTSTQSDPEHIYALHGFYPVQLKATSDQGCTDSLTKIVEIYPVPLLDAGLDSSVSFGFSYNLMGIAPTAVSSSWSPGNTVSDVTNLITEATPLETTEYTLTVTDQFGCQNSDNVIINVLNDHKLLVTNVVTPNGDGVNDTWKIVNATSFNVINVRIYDRWGVEVFNVDNYEEEWDGNLDFDNLPEGTYHYVITFDDADRKYTGSVSILR